MEGQAHEFGTPYGLGVHLILNLAQEVVALASEYLIYQLLYFLEEVYTNFFHDHIVDDLYHFVNALFFFELLKLLQLHAVLRRSSGECFHQLFFLIIYDAHKLH